MDSKKPLLDFGKIQSNLSGSAQTEPRKIFSTLTRKERFKRPTDEQGEVLDAWFARKTNVDNTIKMNTGSGKTLVGLLILQSCLNEKIGPAVYVAPEPHLVDQVVSEARDLGIPITQSEKDPEFLQGKSILVANVHKVFNGRSVFGVSDQGAKIPIGSIIIDDAHACLMTVASQFRLQIPSDHNAYKELLHLFRDDLAKQSQSELLDLEAEDPRSIMEVPYWAWKNRYADVLKTLHPYRNDKAIEWSWPLTSDVLNLCQCVFGPRQVEIAPRCLPIDAIPAFTNANRRIYMTATLADDGVLVTHFQADPTAISKPIKLKGAGDIGDRMILAPQEINPLITFEEVKALATKIAKKRNVVVIVPSKKRADLWSDVAAIILDKDTIGSGVDQLRKKHLGLVVLLNKYDGVDLPKKACELLIIDGLPETYGLIERVEMAKLEGTESQMLRQIQKLEQGMGRGVRSSDDWCVVLLLGERLTARIHLPSSREKFTPATLAQLDLGREVSKQALGKPLSELEPFLYLCLDRDPEWISASKSVVANAKDSGEGFVDPAIPLQRRAFDFARQNKFDSACRELETAANNASDNKSRGYYKEQLAAYMHQLNPNESQVILSSAVTLNRRVTKPLAGIRYKKLDEQHAGQAKACSAYLKGAFSQPNDLIIWTNGLLEDLAWDEDGADRFESAVLSLGLMIGMGSERPELDVGKGPDNLWALGSLKYFVIECKSGATAPRISKKDCNQLNGSMVWFQNEYDNTCSATPIMFHPSHTFEPQSSPRADIRIVDTACLEKLREAILQFSIALAAGNAYLDEDKVADALKSFGLIGNDFTKRFSTNFKLAK